MKRETEQIKVRTRQGKHNQSSLVPMIDLLSTGEVIISRAVIDPEKLAAELRDLEGMNPHRARKHKSSHRG